MARKHLHGVFLVLNFLDSIQQLAGEPTLSAQIEVVPTLQVSLTEPIKSGPDRRRRKRGMFSVPVQIRGGVGTLEVFEDLVTSLDVSRDGLLLSTARGGYSVGQKLHVSCPYWCAPTAINVPRNAQVVRNVLLPNYTLRSGPAIYARNLRGEFLE